MNSQEIVQSKVFVTNNRVVYEIQKCTVIELNLFVFEHAFYQTKVGMIVLVVIF